MKITLHVLPEEAVELADILEAAWEEHRHEWTESQRRIALTAAGSCRHNAAMKGRTCQFCGRPGGMRTTHEGEEITAHLRCLGDYIYHQREEGSR